MFTLSVLPFNAMYWLYESKGPKTPSSVQWGSKAVALDSNDFVTFADCSTGGACLPDVKRLGGKFDSLFIVFVCLSHSEVNKSLLCCVQ